MPGERRFQTWLDERLGLASFLASIRATPAVPRWVDWRYCIGGIAFLALLLQTASGLYLACYYQPNPQAAWKSIEFIEGNLPLGHFLRSMHRWGACLAFLLVLLHMLRVIHHGSYRPPRELNWLSGIGLLLLTGLFAISGYLLPWDLRAYWITLNMANWLQSLPILSDSIAWFLAGDTLWGHVPVSRFFVLHAIVLPILTAVLLFFHFAMVRRLGVRKPE
ncbi:MAG: cytochrome b N-terminal domain-containing protein [Desulfovibrio sp.]|nr:cytochrome b N-terminal domain-containing protein [Desulfovibrio sp.]